MGNACSSGRDQPIEPDDDDAPALPPLDPAAAEEAAAVAASLLGILHRDTSRPELPIKAHDDRLGSGRRGVSLAFLRGVHTFFGEHGMLDDTMELVCKKEGSTTSVCAITRSTGLSLAESVAIVEE